MVFQIEEEYYSFPFSMLFSNKIPESTHKIIFPLKNICSLCLWIKQIYKVFIFAMDF